MTAKCPLLSRKINVLGQVETVPGVVETLTIDDGKIRIYAGAIPEYVAPREKRDIARATLTNLGSLESTKALNITFRSEANTRDTIPDLANLDVDTIDFVSAIAGGAGSIVRYTFNGSPDLTAIVKGDYYDNNYSTNASNDGNFKINLVNAGSDFIEVVNRVRLDASDDEATDSPAVGDIQNVLETQWALNSSGAEVIGISRLAIGAITVASLVRNEVIDAGGGKTGIVLKPAETGDAFVYYRPTGARILSSDVIVGATSGGTATASANGTINGHYVKPVSGDNCDLEAATVEFQNDGYFWRSRSSVANMSMLADANKAMFLDFAYQGPSNDNDDTVLLKPIRDDDDPPILKQAEVKLDAFSPVVSSIAFDMGNVIALRENANSPDASGFESARITSRDPKLTLNVEMELAADFDFFAKYDAGTKIAFQGHAGTVVDKEVWLFVDFLELDNLPVGDKDGITSLEVTGMATGLGNGADDEWMMLFI